MGSVETLDNSDSRLWKSLDAINLRLTTIEEKLNRVVRLEEKIYYHDETLTHHHDKLEDYDKRIRESEIWRANAVDRSAMERLIAHMQSDVARTNEKLIELQSKTNINAGQKDVMKEIFKWVAAILAAVVVYQINKG